MWGPVTCLFHKMYRYKMIRLYHPQAKCYFSCRFTPYFSSHPSHVEDEVLGISTLKITVNISEHIYLPGTVLNVCHKESHFVCTATAWAGHAHHSRYVEDETMTPGSLGSPPMSHSYYLTEQNSNSSSSNSKA